MHVGATIRLLRIGAGVTLRDLADRIGVSSAYLSRVENGHDAPPTAERLEAIAKELGVPSTLLLDVAGRTSPFLSAYIEEVPSAGALFLAIARRNIDARGLARIHDFIEREFAPPRAAAADMAVPPLASLFSPERILMGVSASRLSDVFDVLASRLAEGSGRKPAELARDLKIREREASAYIGNGLMVPQLFAERAPPVAALITLAKPLKAESTDGAAIRVCIGLRSDTRGWSHLARLAQIGRLARYGLAERLFRAKSPQQAVSVLADLEAVR